MHLDILSIPENCSLDWLKVHGVGEYIMFQPVGHILLRSRNQENFILGVEMKEMVDWALVQIGAQMRVVDLAFPPKSKHYQCLWLLFLAEGFSLWY